MYSVDKKQQLKDFALAMSVPVGLTDGNKWPVRAGTVIFPVRNTLVHEFIGQIKQAGIIGDADKWRQAFDNPTQLWRMSHHLINGLLDDEVDKHEIAETILTFLEGVAALNYDHYFERIGKHIIFTDKMLSEAMDVNMITDKKIARKALMLSGLIWSYSEANYFVAHELICEYHGAYPLPDGNFAVVRDLINFSPVELWGNRDYSGMPNKARVITVHDKTLDIGFDAYNNLFDDSGTMASSLLSASVIVDDKVLSVDEIDSYISLFSDRVTSFSDEVNAMSKNEIAHKYMEIFWYRKKSLADYMGVPWKPAAELHRVLDEGLEKGPVKKPGQSAGGRTTPEELVEQYDFSKYL
ncbi:MAG: hypothetical protein LBM93_01490 [Oscillospiraceae bacterium]|jgi:hypothetical protein|nr:hypothetical protein [Oscillospiraceae bacterium]